MSGDDKTAVWTTRGETAEGFPSRSGNIGGEKLKPDGRDDAGRGEWEKGDGNALGAAGAREDEGVVVGGGGCAVLAGTRIARFGRVSRPVEGERGWGDDIQTNCFCPGQRTLQN